jgi:hypothetical protein
VVSFVPDNPRLAEWRVPVEVKLAEMELTFIHLYEIGFFFG